MWTFVLIMAVGYAATVFAFLLFGKREAFAVGVAVVLAVLPDVGEQLDQVPLQARRGPQQDRSHFVTAEFMEGLRGAMSVKPPAADQCDGSRCWLNPVRTRPPGVLR